MGFSFVFMLSLLLMTAKSDDYPLAPPKTSYSLLMTEFMHGFSNYFKVPFPTLVVECFKEKGTILFLDFIEISYELGQSLIEGNSGSYHMLLDSFDGVYEEMTPFLMCQWQTEEWKEIFHVISPEFKIPEQESLYLNFMSKFYKLYSEGQLVEWSVKLKQILKDLVIKNFYQAGYDYAESFSRLGSFLNNSMIEYLKFEAFDMGFIISMGFKYEDSSIFCYTKDTAQPSIEWFYKLAQVIAEADVTDLRNTIEEFFKSSSPELRGQLSEEVGACLEAMPGTEKFLKKFGLHPKVPVFPFAFIHFSRIMPQSFYNQMTKIWEDFDDWDFLNAGVEFGELMSLVLEKYVKKPN